MMTAETDKTEADNLPAAIGGNERRVRRDFWTKLRRYAARLPFTEDLIAAYYCATDRATPSRVRAILFAVLAYFIVPTDMIPDFVAGFGFTDDMTVLLAAIATVRGHITTAHRQQARDALARLEGEAGS